jgi:hypothetical protein
MFMSMKHLISWLMTRWYLVPRHERLPSLPLRAEVGGTCSSWTRIVCISGERPAQAPHSVTLQGCFQGLRQVIRLFRMRFREEQARLSKSVERRRPRREIHSFVRLAPTISKPAIPEHSPSLLTTPTKNRSHDNYSPTTPPLEQSPPTSPSPAGLSCERYITRAYCSFFVASQTPVRHALHVSLEPATTQYKGIRSRTKEQAFGNCASGSLSCEK